MKNPVRSALEAIEKGALSTEEVLRAALLDKTKFEAWLEAQLAAAAGQPPRRPRLRRRRTYPNEVAEAAVNKAKKLLSGRPDVLSVHWGTRHRRGRPTSEPAVVVFLEKKLSPREVLDRDLLPRELALSVKKRRYRVCLDVQGMGLPGSLYGVSAAMPGERAAVLIGTDNAIDGSLGALVDLPGRGVCAILAGHVAEREGLAVRGQFLDQPPISLGTVGKVLRPPQGDAAVAGPVDAAALSLLVSPTRPVRDPDPQDITFTVAIHTLRDFQPKLSSIDGVNATGFFLSQGQRVQIDGLVSLSPQVVSPGDSGAPALDGNGVIVGFVVGAWNGKTYLMPARRAIDALV